MGDLGSRLGDTLASRYHIQGELGRGGMSTVFLAEDPKHHRQVAVKVLDPDVARAVGAERFLHEIEIAAGLTHPNILPVFDSGEADGLLYYVMPYIEGRSLRDHLRRERHVPLGEAVRIVGDVASALGHAHRHGIVHRDIKPENILLTGGKAVVADFGIARAMDVAGTEHLTATGVAVGTPAYMSPEQAGAGEVVDARTDIYGLGCVAYEMLGGEPPFTGASPLAVMARHAVDPVPSLRTLRPTTPPAVERAIQRALAKVPVDRFASAEEFAGALEHASSAQAAARDERRGSGARRLRIGGAAILAIALSAAGWWGMHREDRAAIRRLAVLPFEDAVKDSAGAYVLDGVQEEVISDLANHGLSVIARTSVMQYRNTEQPVRAIGKALNVDAVVEATVTRTADSVSLDARLADARTEVVTWSHTYRVAAADVPSLAGVVAAGLAGKLGSGGAGSPTQTGAARPVDPQAYDAYLHGMAHLHLQTPEDLRTAREYFERAIALDSSYAPAWAGLSEMWAVGRQRGYFTPQESTPPSEAAAYEAIELDSTLAEPHYNLAIAKVYGEWDWAGGEREFQRAIDIQPAYPEARAYYAHLLCILGRPQEAMEQMNLAREMDPLDPFLAWIEGAVLSLVGRYDQAITLYRAALERSPENPSALGLLSMTLQFAGRDEEAYAYRQRWAAALGDSAMAAALKQGHDGGGYRGAMRALADLLVVRAKNSDAPVADLAIDYAAAGDNEEAIHWLERAYEAHSPNIPYIAVHPAFAALHGDPRFDALVKRMNLPEPEVRVGTRAP